MEAVWIEQVDLRRGRKPLLQNVNLAVSVGSFTGILGAQDAGKTTLCRLMAGLTEPSSGHVRLWDISSRSWESRRGLAYAPASPHIRSQMRTRKLLEALSREPHHRTDYSLVIELCSRFHLDSSKPASRLDAAGQKKLALIAALLRPSTLLLLDEPSLFLNQQEHDTLFSLLRERHEAGATVLFTTRSVAEINAYCTHAAVLSEGHILRQGSLDRLPFLSTLHAALTLPAQEAEACMSALGISAYTIRETPMDNAEVTVEFDYPGRVEDLAARLSPALLRNLQVSEPSLESVLAVCKGETL